MPPTQGTQASPGRFPLAILATFAVAGLPVLTAFALQAAGILGSGLLSIALAVSLSLGLAAAGSAWWVRRPAARDLVFADLMLWGWIRRLRTERRIADARELLGAVAELDPARRAELLERLSTALEARDPYTHGHSRRVTRHAHMIARKMGLDREQVARVRTAAAVHDVGKLHTPREVLNKPGRLTDDEFAIIKRHPTEGAEMVAALDDPEIVAMVRHHHERLDGSGYPDGLGAGEIPLGARIIAVADTFDALTSSRPYRPGCRHKRALDILRSEAGSKLDPRAVSAFLGYYSGRKPLAWWTVLTSGPPRLVGWLANSIQGATAAPLASGVGAVGATALIGGALAGSPVPERVVGPADAAAHPAEARALAAGGVRSASRAGDGRGRRRDRSAAGRPGPGGSAPRRVGRSDGAGSSAPGLDSGTQGPASPNGGSGAPGSRRDGPSSGGGDPGSGGNGSGSGGGNSGGGGRRTAVPVVGDVSDVPVVRDVAEVPVVRQVTDLPVVRDLPDVDDVDDVDLDDDDDADLPDLPDLPEVDLP